MDTLARARLKEIYYSRSFHKTHGCFNQVQLIKLNTKWKLFTKDN